MSLIEQKNAFMEKLQRLLDERSKEIDRKVAEFRESLEKETLTPEMKQIVAFINQLDAMIAFEKNTLTTRIEDVQKANEDTIEKGDAETELFENDNVVNEEETFSESKAVSETVENENENENVNVDNDTIKYAKTLVGTGFEALEADAADTRAKLRAAEQARPGMFNIVPPRR